METLSDLRYPIGKFQYDGNLTKEKRNLLINEIQIAPAQLKQAVLGLNDQQLDTPYRPDGWTLRQVVHHIPDSHLNAYVRIKLALTENQPLIKSYSEKLWSNLDDVKNTPIDVSVSLLELLHKRWVILLRFLSDNDFSKSYKHPELGVVDLNWVVAQYAWHGKHHIAHITSLRKRMGW